MSPAERPDPRPRVREEGGALVLPASRCGGATEAGDRQVAGARVGLVETMGGGASGVDGNAAVVAVLGG